MKAETVYDVEAGQHFHKDMIESILYLPKPDKYVTSRYLGVWRDGDGNDDGDGVGW